VSCTGFEKPLQVVFCLLRPRESGRLSQGAARFRAVPPTPSLMETCDDLERTVKKRKPAEAGFLNTVILASRKSNMQDYSPDARGFLQRNSVA
jgi:hypothetical protein